jgi:hypothetical protein
VNKNARTIKDEKRDRNVTGKFFNRESNNCTDIKQKRGRYRAFVREFYLVNATIPNVRPATAAAPPAIAPAVSQLS